MALVFIYFKTECKAFPSCGYVPESQAHSAVHSLAVVTWISLSWDVYHHVHCSHHLNIFLFSLIISKVTVGLS